MSVEGQLMDKEARKSWFDRLKDYAPLIALFSLVIASLTYAGLKPEKKKALEWHYLEQGLIVDPSATSSGITVLHKGREVRHLISVSCRLVNTGDLSITVDRARTERYPTLTFNEKRYRVIDAKVTRTEPNGIDARIDSSPTSITLEHAILNGGDAIYVQLLLEGDRAELEQLPQVEFRIADVPKPITRYLSQGQRVPRVTVFKFSKPWEYGIVIVVSLIGVLLAIMVIGLIGTIAKGVLRSKTSISKDAAKVFDRKVHLLEAFDSEDEDFNKILRAIMTATSSGWSAVELLPDLVAGNESARNILAKHNMDVETFRNRIQKSVLPAHVRTIEFHLTHEFDLSPARKRLRDVFKEVEKTGRQTDSSILARIKSEAQIAIDSITLADRLRVIWSGETVALLIVSPVAAAVCLLASGGWYNLLS